MRNSPGFLTLAVTLLSSAVLFGLTFTQSPRLYQDQGKWWVEFAISDYADVAVSIVDPADSSVVRSLAAGVLGPRPPAPFQANALSQKLEWDLADEMGAPVTNPGTLVARVRAGMAVAMDRIVGDDPYSFMSNNCSAAEVDGMALDSSGQVYILGLAGPLYQGHYHDYTKIIRCYNTEGVYVRTVFPFPANLPAEQARAWGVKEWPDGGFSPVQNFTSMPSLSSTLLAVNGAAGYGWLMNTPVDGELAFGNHLNLMKFRTDGSISSAAGPRIMTTPAMINSAAVGTGYTFGAAFVNYLPGGTHALVSGIFHGLQSSGHVTAATDTNFYADGQIFKVHLSTGAAESWLRLDSVPLEKPLRLTRLGGAQFMASIHETRIDGRGRVFVCDRLHKEIGVYDTNAVKLGAIPLAFHPDRIAISRKTGAIYVVTRWNSSASAGSVILYKFAPWDDGAAKICSLRVTTSLSHGTSPVSFILNESAATTRCWLGYPTFSVKIYDDNGASFGLFKDFEPLTRNLNQGFDRLAIDRRNETVYISDAWDGIFKIENWSNPVMTSCSLSTRRLLGAEMAVSPDYQLYVRECTRNGTDRCGSCFKGPMFRYDLSHIHRPAPFANTGAHLLTPMIWNRYGAGNGEKGIAVNHDGEVALLQYGGVGSLGSNVYYVSVFADSGSNDTTAGRQQIAPVAGQCGGVKYDRAGNLYVGAKVQGPDHVVPSNFTGDWGYNTTVGSVIKFRKNATGSIVANTVPPSADKVYAPGLAPFSRDAGAACICRSPRFEVDPYGRLFVPNAITHQVAVVDNEGNRILEFGKYGNSDSRGGLPGPGTPIASPAVPLGNPMAVAASEDYVYVSDMLNCRLVRVRMDYALDNLAGYTSALDRKAKLAKDPIILEALPNPFGPATTLRFALPARAGVRVDVYTAAGRYVRTVDRGVREAGAQNIRWDGTDNLGRKLAPGTYFFRLTAGGRVIYHTAVLAR